MLTEVHKQFYQDNGYVVIGGLFTPDKVMGYREHYMTLRAAPTIGSLHAAVAPSPSSGS